ncbi:MAG: helix-turn-helix transcriptional regulator [Flavobacteriaceae bacterium]
MISTEEFLDLIGRHQKVQAADLSRNLYHTELSASLRHDWFNYDLQTIRIRDGIVLNSGVLTTYADFIIQFPFTYPLIGFSYGLKGESIFRTTKNELILPANHSIVYCLHPDDEFGNMHYNKDNHIHLSIHFTMDAFRELVDFPNMDLPEEFCTFMQKNSSEVYQTTPILHEEFRILHELLNIDQTGLSRQFLVESRILELISIQLQNITQTSCLGKLTHQKEKLTQCRDLLIENYNNPPSLIELTRQAGINICDLKLGFKQLYGHPPYQYLKNYRLDRAYLMLKEGMRVGEVAMEIGYESISAFSNAFKEKYNMRPSQV